MERQTGRYRITSTLGEQVRAFVPRPLPPRDPPLALDGPLAELHSEAQTALSNLAVAGAMVPDTDWFLYGFVWKEAVVTSQIEGTLLPRVINRGVVRNNCPRRRGRWQPPGPRFAARRLPGHVVLMIQRAPACQP